MYAFSMLCDMRHATPGPSHKIPSSTVLIIQKSMLGMKMRILHRTKILVKWKSWSGFSKKVIESSSKILFDTSLAKRALSFLFHLINCPN